MTVLEQIARLNEERYGLDFSIIQAYDKLDEELTEFTQAFVDQNEPEMVDALADIIVIAAGEIRKLGYDPEKVLRETINEITSRNQDPRQKERWQAGSRNAGEKWLKDKNQDQSTLYKADYEKCKIKG